MLHQQAAPPPQLSLERGPLNLGTEQAARASAVGRPAGFGATVVLAIRLERETWSIFEQETSTSDDEGAYHRRGRRHANRAAGFEYEKCPAPSPSHKDTPPTISLALSCGGATKNKRNILGRALLLRPRVREEMLDLRHRAYACPKKRPVDRELRKGVHLATLNTEQDDVRHSMDFLKS